MLKYFLIVTICIRVNICNSQKLQIEPNFGIQYYGNSYLSKNDLHPIDFRRSRPKVGETWGFNVKYNTRKLTHGLSLQYVLLGSSFSYSNIFLDKGIVPTFQEHSHSDCIDVFLMDYNIQKELCKEFIFFGKSKLKFFYSGGVGIAFNRSQFFYDSVLIPYSYIQIAGSNYEDYIIKYYKGGTGLFLVGRAGFNFYSKKKKNILMFWAFWNQGFNKMEEFSIDYNYGYINTTYQRSVKDVKLKSRGTTFGFMLGVPIHLIKK